MPPAPQRGTPPRARQAILRLRRGIVDLAKQPRNEIELIHRGQQIACLLLTLRDRDPETCAAWNNLGLEWWQQSMQSVEVQWLGP